MDKKIDSESLTRQESDNALGERINEEKTERENKYNELNLKMDKLGLTVVNGELCVVYNM